MSRTTLVGTALAVLTSAAVLTSCGDAPSPGGHGMGSMSTTTTPAAGGDQATGEHNAADTTFAQQMIAHHSQAVEMAELVSGRTTNPKVVDLAKRIREAQGPEIKMMTGWLRAWGEPTSDGGHSMSGMNHGSRMPGMMTDEDMAALKAAKDADFDRRWLSMMIAHHQGAVEMARTELAQGANPEAKTLAQRIIDAQEAEIREMRALLPPG